MTQTEVMRVLTFTSTGSDSVVDDALRARSRAADGAPPLARYVGRRHDRAAERIIVSVWPSISALTTALGPGAEESPVEAELVPGAVDVRLDVVALALHLPFEPDASAKVLRVYRGRTRPGDLGTYVEEVRSGTIADVAARRGPLRLFLGSSGPDEFMTVSAWPSWDTIECATGGNIRNPVATRHGHLLLRGAADHFEIVDGTTEP